MFLREKLNQVIGEPVELADEATIEKLAAAHKEAQEKAGKTARRAAKASAKVQDATRAVEALGTKPQEMDKEPGLQ